MCARSRPLSIADSPNDRRRRNAESIFTKLDGPDHRQNSFRTGLLKRDKNCCVVAGDMDLDEFTRLGDPPDIDEFGPVEGVHIIPFSYGSWNERLREAPKEISR